jgi:membrane protein DedA with SNARE-associated domain
VYPSLLAACAALPDWLNHLRVFGFDIGIAHFLDTYGYVVVALFIGIESTGIPFPGETMLLAASVYAAQGCGLQEAGVIAACTVGATMGDNMGFWVGRTGGRALIQKIPFVKASHLEPAERYFQKYGGATVFFGRFLAVLRAWAAFLAGVNHMKPLKFFIYNFCGAALWSTTFGLLGYGLGRNLTKLQSIVSALGAFGLIVFFAIVFGGFTVFFLRQGRPDRVRRMWLLIGVDVLLAATIYFAGNSHIGGFVLILVILTVDVLATAALLTMWRRAGRAARGGGHIQGATPEALVPTIDLGGGTVPEREPRFPHKSGSEHRLKADQLPASPPAEVLEGE